MTNLVEHILLIMKIKCESFIYVISDSLKLSLSFFLQLYKGRLENGALVAIRCMPLSKKYSIRNLKIRLDLLAKLRHPHLVCLLGHSVDVSGRDDCSMNKVFLISEYVPSGSFHMYLAGNFGIINNFLGGNRQPRPMQFYAASNLFIFCCCVPMLWYLLSNCWYFKF